MQITIREPGSAITHFIGMMMAIFAAVPLLVKAGVKHDPALRRKRHLPLRQSHRQGPADLS